MKIAIGCDPNAENEKQALMKFIEDKGLGEVEDFGSTDPIYANVAIKVAGKCQEQVIHVDGMCNECGNCAVFCPYAGRPYKDKFTLFWSEEDFTNSENEGFYCEENGEIHLRLDGKVEKTDINGIRTISANAAVVIETIQKDYSYLMK